MFEDLEKGVVLHELVADILRGGPRSISQIGKDLQQRGVKLHRLAVAGYLKALSDRGILEEQSIPPAKVYGLKPGAAQRDLYQRVGDECRRHAKSSQEAAKLFLLVLEELFHRPIFMEEFRRGGFDSAPDAVEVPTDDRQLARRFLSKSRLKLPFNDPAFRSGGSSPGEAVRHRTRSILASLLRSEFRADSLAMTTKQATLGGTST